MDVKSGGSGMTPALSWFIVVLAMVASYGIYQIGKDIHRWLSSRGKYMVRRMW